MNAELRQTFGYPSVLLGGVALMASAAISVGDWFTRADIAQRRLEDLQATLEQVVPAGHFDNELVKDTVTVQAGDRTVTAYRARRNGQVQAVCYQVSAPGYGNSALAIMMGVDRTGTLLGVRVISHAETPGLGDKVELRRSNWILGFNGRSLHDPPPAGWGVKKDGGVFDQFTGATITPRAVIGAVKSGLEFFAAHRLTLLDEAVVGGSP